MILTAIWRFRCEIVPYDWDFEVFYCLELEAFQSVRYLEGIRGIDDGKKSFIAIYTRQSEGYCCQVFDSFNTKSGSVRLDILR